MPDLNPGKWVSPDQGDAAPWRSHEGIVKLIEFPVRNPEMSSRDFHIYWQKHHSPHVMSAVPFSQFIRKYLTCHRSLNLNLDGPSHYDDAQDFDGVGEVWLNSLDEVGQWFSHPLYADLIAPDEARFLSQEPGAEFIVGKEEKIFERAADLEEDLLIKVYLLCRVQPGANYNDAHSSASSHGKLILAQDGLKPLLQKLTITHKLQEPIPLEGVEMSNIDMVFEFWFAKLEDAQAFFEHSDFLFNVVSNETEELNATSIRIIFGRLRAVHDEFSFQPTVTQPFSFPWD